MERESATLRAAVIGLGSMGRNHARVYTEMDNIDLVAAADLNLGSISGFSDKEGFHLYENYLEMLEREKLDLVSVAVPTRFHHQVGMEVIRRGIHVLIEKPLASNREEGEELIELARTSGVILGVGHIERFNPVVQALKNHLNQRLLGRLFQITIRRIGPFPERIKDVGILLDLASHDTDLLYYLGEAEASRAQCESARCLHEKYEDLAISTVRFSNGIIGVLLENWLSPIKIREITVNGEEGMLVADLLTQDLYFFNNNYTKSQWESINIFRGMAEGDMTRFHLQRGEPLRNELDAFAQAVRRRCPFSVSGSDGLRALLLVQRLQECSH